MNFHLLKEIYKSLHGDIRYNALKMLMTGGHDGLMTSTSSFAIYGNSYTVMHRRNGDYMQLSFVDSTEEKNPTI